MRDAEARQKAEFIDRENCIAYILDAYFSAEYQYKNQITHTFTNSANVDWNEESYRNYINQLEDAEILDLYRNIKNKETSIRFEHYESIEQYLFFNQPSANADFEYWLSLDFWTGDQAAALSMGKEPSVVNSESMRGPLRSSKTRLTYRNKSDAVLSAILLGNLNEKIEPKTFITWAAQKNWDLPLILVNWAKIETYQDISQRAHQLEARIACLEEEKKILMTQSIDELDPRLQRTFFKMILTMAVARYEHRVGSNSRGPNHIVDDSAALSEDQLELKVDAVRGALQRAADYLGVTSIPTQTPKWHRIKK